MNTCVVLLSEKPASSMVENWFGRVGIGGTGVCMYFMGSHTAMSEPLPEAEPLPE
jgi:hypothetical protein